MQSKLITYSISFQIINIILLIATFGYGAVNQDVSVSSDTTSSAITGGMYKSPSLIEVVPLYARLVLK